MSTVVEGVTVLDHILEDEATCVNCDAGATHRVMMRCCGASALKCAKHVKWWENAFRSWSGTRHTCDHCKHVWGIDPAYEDVVRVIPI